MTPPPIPEGSATKPWGWVQVLLITIFVLPLMLLGVAALSLGGKALFGPVNVFNASRHIVPESEIAGFYAVRSRDVEDLPAKGIYLSDRSGMRLNEDHTMEALDLPAFEKDGSPQACHYDGKGTWSLMQVNESIRLKARHHHAGAASARRAALLRPHQPARPAHARTLTAFSLLVPDHPRRLLRPDVRTAMELLGTTTTNLDDLCTNLHQG